MEILSTGIAVFRNAIENPKEILDNLIRKWYAAEIHGGVNNNIRKAEIKPLDRSSTIYKELHQIMIDKLTEYKKQYYSLQIDEGNGFDIVKYEAGGFYTEHIDTGGDYTARQVSAVYYLNDDYDGGELHFPIQNITIKPEAGMLVIFPSNYMFPHKSLTITKGTKYCIPVWFELIGIFG